MYILSIIPKEYRRSFSGYPPLWLHPINRSARPSIPIASRTGTPHPEWILPTNGTGADHRQSETVTAIIPIPAGTEKLFARIKVTSP